MSPDANVFRGCAISMSSIRADTPILFESAEHVVSQYPSGSFRFRGTSVFSEASVRFSPSSPHGRDLQVFCCASPSSARVSCVYRCLIRGVRRAGVGIPSPVRHSVRPSGRVRDGLSPVSPNRSARESFNTSFLVDLGGDGSSARRLRRRSDIPVALRLGVPRLEHDARGRSPRPSV